MCFILADIIQPYSPVQAAMMGLQRPLSNNCHRASACCPALIIVPCFAIAFAPNPIGEWHRLFFSQLLGAELGCKYCNVSPSREVSSIVVFTFALLVHHTTSHSKNTTWFIALWVNYSLNQSCIYYDPLLKGQVITFSFCHVYTVSFCAYVNPAVSKTSHEPCFIEPFR